MDEFRDYTSTGRNKSRAGPTGDEQTYMDADEDVHLFEAFRARLIRDNEPPSGLNDAAYTIREKKRSKKRKQTVL